MRNPEGVQGQGQHGQIPGLLGMNVINQCYQELFIQHVDPLFQAPGVQALEKEWKKALAECRQLDRSGASWTCCSGPSCYSKVCSCYLSHWFMIYIFLRVVGAFAFGKWSLTV